jgi:hypothetical protein
LNITSPVRCVVVLSLLVLSKAHAAPPDAPPTDAAAGSAHWSGLKPVIVHANGFAETPELLKLGPGQPLVATDPDKRPVPIRFYHRSLKAPGKPSQRDPVVQSSMPALDIPSPGGSFEGINNVDGYVPPDTVGAIGPSNFVQCVNVRVQVFDRFTGAPLTAANPISSLFAGLGGGSKCATTDDGDPIVVYDQLADRWLIAQFANASSTTGPFYMSIAVSKTSDPTGPYYAYCFQTPGTKFPDYPKFGVWPDGYYMSDNQFNAAGTAYQGAGVFAFDRAKMLVGDPTASFIYYDLNSVDSNIFGLLPSSVDGPPPPIGTPNYFTYIQGISLGDPRDALRIFQFHADFAHTNLSSFTERAESPVSVAAFTAFSPSTPAITQPGTSQKLDSLADRLMFRLQYRNFNSLETLVVNHTVNGGSGQAAVRYYQLRRSLPGGAFGIYDQATFAPDSTHRWMGSASMNYRGDLAVGYSVSSSSVYPSIRYAARLSTDLTNQLTQGEATLVTGSGSQAFAGSSGGGERWGDYSAMTVDPTDDCTFWYTDEYYTTTSTSSWPWRTRFGSFTLPGCTPAPQGTIRGTVTNAGLPVPNAVVRTANGYVRVTDAAGNYSMTVSPSSFDMSVIATGLGTQSVTSVIVADGGTTIQNFSFGGPVPVISAAGATLLSESCNATNGVIDPNETVTVNLALKNIGTASTSNLVATLLATGGVSSPSGPQTYGSIGTNAVVALPFTFTATGACGGALSATLSLQDGTNNYGSAIYGFTLGQLVSDLAQNFDGVSVPALPVGWSTAATGGQSNWVTSSALSDTAPNAAYTPDLASIGVNELDSPTVSISSTQAVLSFRHNYSFAAGADGGVLEIKIGAGSFTDIVTAGGIFTTGGYNATLTNAFANPLAGRAAWSGNSGGFSNAVVQLPASAAGQSIQLRWRAAAGSNTPPVSSSGTLAFWGFDGSNPAPTLVAASISGSTVTTLNASATITYPSGNPAPAISGSGFSTAGTFTISTSCFAFSITASNGTSVTLNSLSFDDQRSNQGPTNFVVQISQASDFSTAIYTSTAQTSHTSITSGANTFPLFNSNLTGTVYFRLFGYKAGSSGGTWRIDNINLQGTATSGGTPGSGWYLDTIALSDPVCCAGITNSPPVINAAHVSPSSPTTTNDLLAVVTSATDPDNNPISFAYQWQESSTNLIGQTASNLPASVTFAGGSYRVVITPNDGIISGAPFTTTAVLVPIDADGNGINDDWEVAYFGHIGVNPNADPDGDGLSNLQEFEAGTDPTNAASTLAITSIASSGSDLVISWQAAHGKSYVVQTNAPLAGEYTNSFADLSPVISIPDTNIPGTMITNYLDGGGTTNVPARYYRVRLLP